MSRKERTAGRLIEEFDLSDHLSGVTDIRTNPTIPLPTILLCVLLMPLLYLSSLLAVDRLCRRAWMKRLFGVERRMVVSDSTIRRALGWLSHGSLNQLLRKTVQTLEQRRLLTTRLADGARHRRIGVIDGTFMSCHWVTVFCLCGTITTTAMLRRCAGEGYERREGRRLVAMADELDSAKPELLLLDALYFDTRTVKQVRTANMHVLIKSESAEYRSVTAKAKDDFDTFGRPNTAEGYDTKRLCRWNIAITTGRFAGFPVQVAHLEERYTRGGQTRRCWITTTDFSLSPAEVREAAHRRWSIETYFKTLNATASTKRFAVKNREAFTALLMLLAIGMALTDAAMAIISNHPRLTQRFLQGEKPTRRAWSQRMAEALPARVFVFRAP